MIVGVDIDGVLANFCEGYAHLLTKMTGMEFPQLNQKGWPDTWYWDRAAGLQKKDENAAWEFIKKDSDFWYKLSPLKDARTFLMNLPIDHDYYFVTNRPGLSAKRQTEAWLYRWGGSLHQTVLLSAKKADVCKALDIDFYLDDKQENCDDVKNFAPKTKGYMLATGYNSEIPGVPRIEGVLDFLEVIKNAAKS